MTEQLRASGTHCTGQLTIDLDAICSNWKSLNSQVGSETTCAAVVKADAYGTGLSKVSKALYETGVRTFFTALPEEGDLVREAAPEAVIYVLGGLFHGRAPLYARSDLRPVLNSLEECLEWAQFCESLGKSLPVALHLDTGMNRLGFHGDDLKALLSDKVLFKALNISLVLSHLACADEPDHPLNAQQLATFKCLSSAFPDTPKSLANSSGVFLGEDYHFDLVRPGVALYGGNPTPYAKNPMKHSAYVTAEVLQVRTVPKGATVGYGARQMATRDTRIAVINIGYADGMHRLTGSSDERSGSYAYINQRRIPYFGRVSMDLIALDVTDVPSGLIERGSTIEVLGQNVSVDEVAFHANTVAYELLTSLGKRYKRFYLSSTQYAT
ncbi:alanine racemase [Flexibacterium corallicola]|uniref:alanine racemase n=1 Tax=Flexibacterium corallicola TaxID=3037259 RepID=UPI00286F9F87|nr:alanine racemase [Pseudovibrio sp. M1P-2-3]